MASPSRFEGLLCDLLRRGVAVRFRARGESMLPTIRAGDLVTVVPLDGVPAGARDIVLYRSDRGLFAHRVIRRRHDVLVVRGDSHGRGGAEVIASAQVLGRLSVLERNGLVRRLDTRRAKLVDRLRALVRRAGRRVAVRGLAGPQREDGGEHAS